MNIIWQSRLPQVLTAIVAGAGLAVSGLQMQTVFRNPLAGPSVLGISNGSALGVAFVVLLSGKIGGVALSRLGYNAVNDLTIITGQKPIVTKAKKSIAAFKLREGAKIGCKVTLRSGKMYDFAYKLFNVALPRVRDFRGVSDKSFDGRGNYSMGIKEQLIFPEIEYDKIDKLRGMDIIFVTTAKTDEEARELLKLLGMPFRN